MGDVNLEIKLNNLDDRVIKIEESGGSGGDGYITSVSNDFNVVNKKLSLSTDVTTKLSKVDTPDNLSVELEKKVDKGVISDAYDELKTYSVGEYCIYNNSVWKCLVQNNGQTPTEGTYWTNVTVKVFPLTDCDLIYLSESEQYTSDKYEVELPIFASVNVTVSPLTVPRI